MIHLRPYFLIAALALLHSASTPVYSKKLKAKARGDASSDKSRSYYLKENYCGEKFLDAFTWETFDDPTHGRVNYVGKDDALATNLSFASFDKFVMRADSTNYVSPSARGRDSVRIISNDAYAECIIVLDIQHMPEGCGTWPAFWTLSRNGPWPSGGEIDIIEGVNLNTMNLISLHTTPGCSMDVYREQKGYTVSKDCNTEINSNQGCGTNSGKQNSYGTGFNDAGGGFYVMERSRSTGIRVWFWSRAEDRKIPTTVKQDMGVIWPGAFGKPDAHFPTTACDYDSHFDEHQIIFDTTFCGDWAGAVFKNVPCGGGSCADFVNDNPDAFTKAFWEINSLRIYTKY